MRTTRWGICSAGNISHDFIVALKTLPAEDHKLVAIASRDLNRSQKYAETHSIPKAYGSYEELAQDPDVDVVYVGVIHPYHLPVTLLFIQSGKNVLCEKPLAMNSTEVQRLVKAAQEKRVFLMEAFWTRFFPASGKIRSLLKERALGDAAILHVEFGNVLPRLPQWWCKTQGAGGLLHIGVYCVQWACMIFNGERPETVVASGFVNEGGIDETATIILNYSGQRQAVLTYSITCRIPNGVSISCTKGIIEVPDHSWSPSKLVVNGKEEEFPLPSSPQKLNFPTSIGLCYEAEHVRQCLLQGLQESPIMSLEDSEVVHSIMDEVRRQLGVSYPQDYA